MGIIRSYNFSCTTKELIHLYWILDCKNGHLEVVQLLLQHRRVDPSAMNDYAIRWARRNGQYEIVRLLLQDGRVDPTTT